jgi:hypothetical protein
MADVQTSEVDEKLSPKQDHEVLYFYRSSEDEIRTWRAVEFQNSRFLAYFPKIKVGLPSHQRVCPPLITFEPLGRFTWYLVGRYCHSRDRIAIILNPVSLTILKWLTFKVVSWRQDFKPCTAMVWDCLIVGLLWLHQYSL